MANKLDPTIKKQMENRLKMNQRIPWVLLIFGLIIFPLIVTHLLEGYLSPFWKKYPATVTKSYVESYRNSNRTKMWRVKVHYNYEVEGMPFSGQRYSYDNQYNRDFEAEKIAKKFKNGDDIQISVNPLDHSRSVIVTGINKEFFFVGIAIFLLTLLFSLKILSNLKKDSKRIRKRLLQDKMLGS